jgi:hypothetical protein
MPKGIPKHKELPTAVTAQLQAAIDELRQRIAVEHKREVQRAKLRRTLKTLALLTRRDIQTVVSEHVAPKRADKPVQSKHARLATSKAAAKRRANGAGAHP